MQTSGQHPQWPLPMTVAMSTETGAGPSDIFLSSAKSPAPRPSLFRHRRLFRRLPRWYHWPHDNRGIYQPLGKNFRGRRRGDGCSRRQPQHFHQGPVSHRYLRPAARPGHQQSLRRRARQAIATKAIATAAFPSALLPALPCTHPSPAAPPSAPAQVQVFDCGVCMQQLRPPEAVVDLPDCNQNIHLKCFARMRVCTVGTMNCFVLQVSGRPQIPDPRAIAGNGAKRTIAVLRQRDICGMRL